MRTNDEFSSSLLWIFTFSPHPPVGSAQYCLALDRRVRISVREHISETDVLNFTKLSAAMQYLMYLYDLMYDVVFTYLRGTGDAKKAHAQ